VQMKEICEKTGLTDRAVRLYIENGLLSPAVESNYAGRRSIRFTEGDAEILLAIAALRRAEFSLADIHEMQTAPEKIPELVEAHSRNLRESVEARQRTLVLLGSIEYTNATRYTDIAALLCEDGSQNSIPKEDSGMRLKDLQSLIRRRIPSVIGFAAFLIGTVLFAPLAVRAAFADPTILVGGGYKLDYAFTGERLVQNLPLLILPILLLIGAVLLFLHILTGKRPLALAAGILAVGSILWMLLLPEGHMSERLYLYEFLRYRYSFLYTFLRSAPTDMEILSRLLKFIPPAAAAICCIIGWISHKEEH